MARDKSVSAPVNTVEGKGATSAFHPFSEMERAFGRFFNRSRPAFWSRSDFPAFDTLNAGFEWQRTSSLDAIDQGNKVVVRAEITGIDKQEVRISLTDNLLTIKDETKQGKKDEKDNDYRREISHASFARIVSPYRELVS